MSNATPAAQTPVTYIVAFLKYYSTHLTVFASIATALGLMFTGNVLAGFGALVPILAAFANPTPPAVQVQLSQFGTAMADEADAHESFKQGSPSPSSAYNDVFEHEKNRIN